MLPMGGWGWTLFALAISATFLAWGCGTVPTDVLPPPPVVAGVVEEDPNANGGGEGETLSASSFVALAIVNLSTTITLTGAGGGTSDLTFSIVSNPSHGILSGLGKTQRDSAIVMYSPKTGYTGLDSFTYRVSNGVSDSPPATVTSVVYSAVTFGVTPQTGLSPMTVTCTAYPPAGVALPDVVYVWKFDETEESGPKSTHAQRTHVFSTAGTHTVSLSLAVVGGTASLACLDRQSNTYKAQVTTGAIVSGYVRDAAGQGIPGVTVSGNNGAGTTLVDADGSYRLSVPYGWTGSITPGHGEFTFDPANRSYVNLKADAVGQSFVATPRTSPTNQSPTVEPQSVVTGVGTPVSITLTGTDPEGANLTFSVVSGPSHGTLGTIDNSAASTAAVVYTPTAGYSGSDAFAFKANDGTSDSIPAVVQITITGASHPPIAESQSIAVMVNTAKTVLLSGRDADGDPLTYAILSQPTHGVLSGTAPNLTYTPATDYQGTDSLAFTVSDGTSQSNVATVTLIVSTWAPPIGIPIPSFGIFEKHTLYAGRQYDFGGGPVPYPDAGNGPYTHYVDNTHPNATDTNNPFGTADRPRMTIPRYLGPGQVVELHGGPYTTTDRFWFEGTGTATQPIFIRGTNPSGKIQLQRRIHPLGEYMIFENLEIRCADIRPMNGKSVAYLCIRHVELAGSGGFKSGEMFMVTSSDPNNPVHDIVLWDNYVHDNGQYDAPTEDDTCAFSVQANAYNIWIVDNVAHHSGGDGVILAHNANFTTHHIYVGRNEFHHHRENGVDIKQCEDVVVSQNKLYGYAPVSSSSGEAAVVHYDARRIWFLFNEISDAQFGIVSTGAYDLCVIGNIIHDIRRLSPLTTGAESPHRGGIGIRWYNTGRVYVHNNTIYDCVTGIGADLATYPTEITNNILSSMDATENGYHLTITAASGVRQASTMDNNAFHQPGGSVRIWWGGGPYDLAGFQSAFPGKGVACLEQDPQFVNPSANDYHLQEGSPCIDAGRDANAYAQFLVLYGDSILADAQAMVRPYGMGLDLGAFEWRP